MTTNRRRFIGSAAALAGAALAARPLSAFTPEIETRFASNSYPWLTFFNREGKDWSADLDASLAEFARSGVRGFEPGVTTPEEIDRLVPLLRKHGLWMTSIYANSTLHERDLAGPSMAGVLAVADAARRAGVRIVVTNPSPIRWGGPEDKTDAQLEEQAVNLDRLGRALRDRGLILAYHNHDPEMRRSAREFHHMMLGTNPDHVRLCLDAHWVYRGSGDSQLALFDIVRLYGTRIVELHIRQSQGGVWSEVFGPGDIDYPRLVSALADQRVRPHLVLEQCVEEGSPETMDGVEAHRRSLAYAAEIFAPLAS